jgi:hypothetical protein
MHDASAEGGLREQSESGHNASDDGHSSIVARPRTRGVALREAPDRMIEWRDVHRSARASPSLLGQVQRIQTEVESRPF